MQRRSHIAFMCVLVGAVLFTVESHGQLFGRRWHARSQQSYQVSQENSKFKSLIERSSIRRSQGLPFVDVAVSGETQVKNGLIALTLSLKFSPEYPKAVTVKSVDVTGTNQASSTLTTGALMETHTKLVGLFRRNNRDAVRVSVVFNEYPTESVGFELQVLQPATTVVHTPPRSFNFVPPHIAGDADFDAGNNNPTDFRMGVIIEISPDSRRLFASKDVR